MRKKPLKDVKSIRTQKEFNVVWDLIIKYAEDPQELKELYNDGLVFVEVERREDGSIRDIHVKDKSDGKNRFFLNLN